MSGLSDLTNKMKRQHRLNYWLAISAVVAGGISMAEAQLQVAGSLLVNIDATTAPLGSLASITNNGTLGGVFEARYGTNVPAVAIVNGNGSQGIRFDGRQFLQHVNVPGGTNVPADATLTGVNPTLSIEVWALNPGISGEETMVSWGHRGGNPDGSNMSFNYGFDDRWGAAGHWGGADMGWDPCCDGGSNPPGVPRSGDWHHLVYTFDGSVQRAYADGVLKNSEVVGLNIFAPQAIMIGAQWDNDGATVLGDLRSSMTMAKVRIHSEALTATQVATNYTLEASGFSVGGSPLPFGPIHRYSFSNPAGVASPGSVITDRVGTAHGVVRGDGANFTGTRLTLPGGSSGSAAYVDLPNGLLSTNGALNGGTGEITMEGWVKNTGTRNWGRIYDFGNGLAGEITDVGGNSEGRDYWFLSGSEGTNPQRHNVSIRNLIPPTGSDTGIAWDTANANRDFHFAVSWKESTGEWLIYENGTLVASRFVDPANDKFSAIQDVNVWLGRSNWTTDENFQGEYDEFRIYNHVLTPQQIRASYTAGPDSLATADPVSFTVQPQNRSVNEFGTTNFSVAVQGALPISLQWYKNSNVVAGATSVTLTVTNASPSNNGATYFAIASNNIGGTAFYATSSIATLTVIADTTPPTITMVRANSSTNIEIIFSERINPADIVTGNFSITGPSGPLTVIDASVSADNKRAFLTVAAPIGEGKFIISPTGIHDVSAGANVIAPGTTVILWNLPRPTLTHRYTFNNPVNVDASGATVPDVVGTAHGIVRNGAGLTTFTGDRITLSGGSPGGAPYIDLPNGLLSSHSTNNGGTGQVTFEGWVRVTGNRSWSRIFDFGSSGPCCAPGVEIPGPGGSGDGIDYFFYSAENGTDVNTRRIDLTNRDQSDHGTAGSDIGVTNFNTEFHFVVTWDETSGRIRVYENGAQVASVNTVAAMSEINDVNVWLGRSNWNADQNMQGEFNEFRVYDRVLSQAEAGFDTGAGPDFNFGAPLALDLVATNTSYYTNSVQPLAVLVSFGNAGTQNVAGVGLVTYSSSDSNVVEITSDGLLHTHNAGTGTVTAVYFGVSETETIIVTADNTAPTIVSARANTARFIEVTYSEPVDPGSGTDTLLYSVTTASGESLTVTNATQFADQRKVQLELDTPMRSDYISVQALFVADLIGNFAFDNGTASFVYHQPVTMKHRYTFNTASNAFASGLTVPDLVGAGTASFLGSPVVLSGSRVVLGGGASGTAGYVDLPNGLISTNSTNNGGSGQVTIEGWYKITGNRAWARVFDFGSSGICCGTGGEIPGSGGPDGIDYLMLSAENGTDIGTRRFELNNRDQGGHGAFAPDYSVTNFNQDIHFVVTWDERTGQLRLYENGVLRLSPTTVAAMSEINDVNVWLGRSNWTGDQNLQGEFDDFRIYNRVLGTNEIDVDRIAGPDNNFGVPQALSLNMATLLQSGQAVVPQSLATFSRVTNADFSFSGVVKFQSSNPLVVSADASGVLHTMASGIAIVTQSYAGFVNTITVTVTNAAPVAGTDGLAVSKNGSGRTTVATMLLNDTDPDNGYPLSVTGVSATSTNGGSVTLTGTNVTYTPVTDYIGADLFTYTLSDAFGATTTGQVVVDVINGPVPDNNAILFRRGSGGSYDISFRGTSGTTYRILRSTDVMGPWTTVVSTQTAPLNGIITYNDPTPPAGQAFYKVVTP